MTINFDFTDFSESFTPFDRTIYLPRLARIAAGLTDAETTSDEDAKRIAIAVAEKMLVAMRRRIDALERG